MSTEEAAPQVEDARRRLPAGRKAQLAAVVAEQGQMTVAELADRFGVSVDTIRRDLDQLDADGILIRTHGGAVSPNALPKPETALEVRRRVQTSAKETIGALAAGLVSDGSSLLINGGTTALAVARHLGGHADLTIGTNNLLLSTELPPDSYRALYVFGGTVRFSSQATMGPVTFPGNGTTDLDVHADLALIAVGGATVNGGYNTSHLGEAQMMRAMMDRGDEVAILIDSTKFGRKLFAQFAPLDKATYVVTDKEPPAEFQRAFADAGVTVVAPTSAAVRA